MRLLKEITSVFLVKLGESCPRRWWGMGCERWSLRLEKRYSSLKVLGAFWKVLGVLWKALEVLWNAWFWGERDGFHRLIPIFKLAWTAGPM